MSTVLRNIGCLATCPATASQSDLGLIDNAALVWDDGRIVWVGKESDLPRDYSQAETWDADAKLVVPGLIDCHTHLAFGGWRADEFEMRALGKGYLEIAKAGGGILSTVRATRAASYDQLLERCRRSLSEMYQLGLTTVECKSGYGLTLEDELKLLRVYRELQDSEPATIVSTFLGAHTIPPEYKDDRAGYCDLVIEQMLPQVAQESLAQFCDIFVEDSAFSAEEARRVLAAARDHSLGLKLHVDQLSDGAGAKLAAEMGAISADHLEFISPAGITALKRADVVAVSLPIASLCTQTKPLQARPLIEAGVRVAVATDFNPGSAPSYHLPLAMLLAVTMNGMSPSEVVKGVTINAAAALGVDSERGSLEPGKYADFCIIDAADVNHWLYHFRANACLKTVKAGTVIWRTER